MTRLKHFITNSIVGGLLVILPAALLLLIFRWIFDSIIALLAPIADPLVAQTGSTPLLINALVLLMIVLLCFVVGVIVTTGVGSWLHQRFDSTIARLAPGYQLVKDIVHQILGDKSDSPFTRGEVARVKIFGAGVPTDATAIITSRHANGWYTAFVPTGPNPTSGFIYHLPPELVELLPNVKVDEALRTIIACGAGSNELFARPTTRSRAV